MELIKFIFSAPLIFAGFVISVWIIGEILTNIFHIDITIEKTNHNNCNCHNCDKCEKKKEEINNG